MSLLTVLSNIKAFFTEEEHKIATDYDELHATIANFARRIEALEQAVAKKAEAVVAEVKAAV